MKRMDIEQVMLDLQEMAGKHGYGDIVCNLGDLIKALPPEVKADAEQLYHRHKYKNISFSQSTTFNDNDYAGVVSECGRMTVVLFEAICLD